MRKTEIWSVLDLVTTFLKLILIPPFQRLADVWSLKDKVMLINSILKGRTVPAIVVGTVDDTDYMIDGQQRSGTLQDFIENKFPYSSKRFTASEKEDIIDKYDGLYFKDLPIEAQTKIKDYELVIQIKKFNSMEEAQVEYRILNERGCHLTKQEKVKSDLDASVREILEKVQKWSLWKQIVTKTNRMQDMLVIYNLFHILGSVEMPNSKDMQDWMIENQSVAFFNAIKRRLEKIRRDIVQIFENIGETDYKGNLRFTALVSAIDELHSNGHALFDVDRAREALMAFQGDLASSNTCKSDTAGKFLRAGAGHTGVPENRKIRKDIILNTIQAAYIK